MALGAKGVSARESARVVVACGWMARGLLHRRFASRFRQAVAAALEKRRLPRVRQAIATVLGIGSLASTGLAAAQPLTAGASPAPPPPTAAFSDTDVSTDANGVVPPRLLTTEPVAYPEDGRGSASVVLELLVAEDGSVAEVRVVDGTEPFSSAALAAARAWRFAPASVDGSPRAVRIRTTLDFEEEAPPEAATSALDSGPTSNATPGQVPGRPPPAAIEVNVEGERVVGRTTLSKVEIRELPGAMGDPFRAIEALPGVTPLLSGIPFFFIRGAPPGNQGYFFDGVRVPLLYHLGLGPGVIHPELVERVDLYAGGYPARYGRFVGGVVAAESAPPQPDFHGHANIRLVDSGGLVHAPFAHGRGSATASGRYSYTARMIELIEPSIRLQYWDYQLRTRWQPREGRTWEALAFGSFDLFRQEDLAEYDDETGWKKSIYRLGTEFHRLDLRHDFVTDAIDQGRVAITLGTDRSRQEETDELEEQGQDRMLAARLELEHRAGPRRLHRGGADVTMLVHELRFLDHNPESSSDDRQDDVEVLALPDHSDLTIGAWSDAVLDVTPRIQLVVGGRCDVFSSDGVLAVGIDPRIAATFTVHERVRLVHAFGIAHQLPSFVAPVPGLTITDLADGLQRSAQSSAGVEVDLPAGFTSSTTLFQHATFNSTDLLSVATFESALDEVDDDITRRSIGHTYGVELLLRRASESRLGGFLAYTLSRSTRRMGQYRNLASFDRTHVLNAAISYDLGRRWRAGARFVFYSGIPVEMSSEEAVVSPAGEVPAPVPIPVASEIVQVRTAPYWRIDWRIQKRWRIGSSGAWWAFTAEVLNTTLNREEVSPDCPDGSCTGERIGPVTVPAIGVEAAF